MKKVTIVSVGILIAKLDDAERVSPKSDRSCEAVMPTTEMTRKMDGFFLRLVDEKGKGIPNAIVDIFHNEYLSSQEQIHAIREP